MTPTHTAGLTPRYTNTARRHRGRRLRVETLETRVVPSTTPTEPTPSATEKVRYEGPPLLTAPEMPAFSTLDVAIVSAIRHAWQVPAGTATDRWLIQLPAGQSPDVLQPLGAIAVQEVPFWANSFEVTFAADRDVAAFPAALGAVTTAEFFYPIVEREMAKKWVPNDPMFGQQWHLNNTGQGGGSPGADANLVTAWDLLDATNQPVRGNGVVIGVVDDGLQINHEDIAPNYFAADSWDFNNNDSNPTPAAGDYHGTAVGGVAAGRGNNSIGITGSAPEASLAGLRLLGAPFGDTEEGLALGYHPQSIDIYSNSWGPVDNGTLGFIGPQALAAIQSGYNTGRGGLGSIYTWAAGNGLGSNDNVNYDAYANSRYVIAVGAITDSAVQSWYSEPGAPMLVTAYSNGGVSGITTTDAPSGYMNDFGGTSSATPLVSGIIALMLDANPNLTARDVQHVLVRTAEKNHASDGGWTNNAAGFHVNHKYGFGAIDAQAAVNLARTWSPVPAEQTASSGVITVNQSIPDDSTTGVTSNFNFPTNLVIEHVEVVLNVPDHTYVGDLRVVLTAPSGTQSILAESHGDSGPGYSGWVFSSVRHWGESSAGQWSLKVSDEVAADLGTFQNWTIRVYGTPAGAPPTLSAIETSTLSYVAGQGELPITATLGVADADSANLNGATVSISANYAAGQDFLRFTNQNGISGSFAGGTLTLTGSATVAQYEAALRSVRYENTAASPSTLTRTVGFRVTDPVALSSNVATRNISVVAVNQAPTLNPISDPAPINEDAGNRVINLSGISAGPGETQVLTVTATSDNPAVVPNPTVNYTSPNATGSLSYAPVANQFGTATITVKVKDSGGTANGGVDEVIDTFTVVVNSVNDAPAFTKGANQVITFGTSGQQSVPSWASGIGAGAPNESGQVLDFLVSNDNNALFTVQPDVALDGTLTYTPAAGAFGVATVTVTLTDDGGTANGGQNASQPQTFTIEIDVNDAPTVSPGPATQLTTVPKFRTDPPGDLVTIFGPVISDPDLGQTKGIAVVGLTAEDGGDWEFSLDGGASWTKFGTASLAAARLVGHDDLIRFVPNGAFVGNPELAFRAWDQTTNAAGDVVNLTLPGSTGGQTAFSVGMGTARLRVAPALTPIPEDNPKNKGDKVGTLLTGLIADLDAKAKPGLAITGFTSAVAGTWQFSVNGGKTWKPFPAVTAANALLVGDKDKVRFLPDAEQSGDASFRYRAWDQTTGVRGTTADLTGAGSTGGGTAFSTQEDVFFAQVVSMNDRPVVDRGFKPVLVPVAPENGNTVANLLGASVTDADGDPRGIAVIGAASKTGRWEFRLGGAGPWSAVGVVSLKAALLLRGTDEIRFVPNAGFSGTASFTYRAWDGTEGTAGTPFDARKALAFSAFTQTALVNLGSAGPANNAPNLDTSGSPTLAFVGEDQKAPGDLVSALLGSAFSDPDAGAKRGIAVVGLTGTADGRWEFSTKGGLKWTAMTSIGEAHALMLRETDLVRYVPNLNYVGTRTMSYRAWDQTAGSGGQYADLTTAGAVGGTGAAGPEVETAAVTVTPFNDAPAFNTTRLALFTPQPVGSTTHTGDTVAALLGTSITDPDAGDAQGIAITKVDARNGSWMYQVNGAGAWDLIPSTASPLGAFVLQPQDRILFFAETTFEGTATMQFKAWDQSQWVGATGIPVPTTIGTAFSKAARTAQASVTSGNSRPILDTKAVRPLTPVLPDVPTPPGPAGNTAASLIAGAVIDPDGTGPFGIAVTMAAVNPKVGTWQFSTNGGTSWLDMGTVSRTQALLLRAQDLIRFVPATGFRGSAKLSYVAWDQSSGTQGSKVNVGDLSATAFSLKPATSLVKVNTAPTLNA